MTDDFIINALDEAVFTFKRMKNNDLPATLEDMVVTYGGGLSAGDQIWITILGKNLNSLGTAHATIVPEPSTVAMIGLGILGLAVAGRKRLI